MVERLTPSSGMLGTKVTIEGRDFGSRGDGPFYDPYCHVKFGKSFAKIIKWEDNEIVVEVPSDYGTGIEDVEFIAKITSLAIGGLWGEIIKIFAGLFVPMVESPSGTIGGVSEEVQVATSAGTGKSVFTWGGEVNTLTPEEIELIRNWGYGGNYVARWPDGFVGVYDETNYSMMQDVINEWNYAINGPVKFYLSSNPNSPVKVIFDSYIGYCGYEDVQWGDDHTFSEVIIKINPSGSCCGDPNIKYCLYLHMFNAVVGFNYWAEVDTTPFGEWSNFNTIPDTIKTMLRALHRVPPGYYLGESKQKKDHYNNVINNIFTCGGGNCLDEVKVLKRKNYF